MPDGKLMIEKAVERLDLEQFDRVLVVCLREHLEQYLSEESLNTVLGGINHPRIDTCILDVPTSSQSETVAEALKRGGVEGAFFVKDCDNMFGCKWSGENEIAVLDLNNVGLIDAKNKSYVTVDAVGNVSNIVEKQVISNYFCCGGYGFRDAAEFLTHYHSINSDKEVYISHVIYSMLIDGIGFKITNSHTYVDWGTLREYRHYCRSFLTVFCDVDGVLLYNGSKFGKNGWNTAPIAENLNTMAQLQEKGLLYLVITTSRPESEMAYLVETLGQHGVRPDKFVMGLPHTRRLLVNDFSATNPFPSAIAINIERDSKLLSSMLDSLAN
jgi:hypothetical protein